MVNQMFNGGMLHRESLLQAMLEFDLIYYRDPLLEKICERINALDCPAYVKNSGLVYVQANVAFASLFNANVDALIGTATEEHEDIAVALNNGDKERACLVFGEDQASLFADPFGKGRYRIEMERFTLADGQTYLYCVMYPVAHANPSPQLVHLQDQEFASRLVEEVNDQNVLDKTLIQMIVDTFDIGVCVYDRDNRLTYFNENLNKYYSPLTGSLEIGADRAEMTRRIFLENEKKRPEALRRTPEECERRIKEIVDAVGQGSDDDFILPDGRSIHGVNRRLADGSLVGLRLDVTDLKHREQQLDRNKEENSLYQQLFNHLPVAAFARDQKHRLVFVNQAYADLFGRTIEELLYTEEPELLGDEADLIRELNRRTIEEGLLCEEEQLMPRLDGTTVPVIAKTGRIITEKGSPYIVGTIADISIIKQRELLLQEANETAEAISRDFENIILSIDIGLIVLDKDLRIRFINDAYRTKIWPEAARFTNAELQGQLFSDFIRRNFDEGRYQIPEDELESYVESRIGEIRAGKVEPRELLLADGSVIFYSGIPLSGGRFLLSFVDLTELRRRDHDVARAHAEVEKAYRMVRSATDSMPEGLMVIEGDCVVFANEVLSTLLHVPSDTIKPGQQWEDAYRVTAWQNPDSTEESVVAGFQRFQAALKMGKSLNYRFPLNGQKWMQLQSTPTENGQMVLLLSDLTNVIQREDELKRLIANAEAADRAKSEFLANMSHEIRTPMNGILGMAELLSKSSLDTRQKTFIDIIVKSGNALMTIINDILDFSKLDAGHLQLKTAPFDPGEAVEDVAALLSSRAIEKDIELIVHCLPSMPALVIGDAGRFRQIVTNLVGNAVKFTERGHVLVEVGSVAAPDGTSLLEVLVSDTGIGIPSDKIGAIFEKFSQVDGSTTRRHEGTGLGLAISQRLANLQRGVISVSSVQGRGSDFTLRLPTTILEMTSKAKPVPANIIGARVVVIEDNEISRQILEDQIRDWGFEVVSASDGVTGLCILDAAANAGLRIDAVVLDCQMHGMNGADVARSIRSNGRLRDTGIILLTSVELRADDQDFSEMQVQAHVMKPVRTQLLRDSVIEVIRAMRMRKSGFSENGYANDTGFADMPSRAGDAVSRDGFPAPNENALSTHPGNGPRVLVAEDNEVNQIVFRQVLDAAGIQFLLANDGLAAVELWQQFQPDVVIMDVSMPVMNGLQATMRIREMEASRGVHTPIIGVTAHALDSDRDMCLDAGMDDYLPKPISPERLEDKIRLWYETRLSKAALG
jgi:PAS domain S-box-containing protein